MQCRHEIISMRHNVAGTLKINREQLHFGKGIGYIEKDRGTSFPDQYVWTSAAEGRRKIALDGGSSNNSGGTIFL